VDDGLLRRSDIDCEAAAIFIDPVHRFVLQWVRILSGYLHFERKEQSTATTNDVRDAGLLKGSAVNLEPPAADFLDQPLTDCDL
jgi:hypothetical protein